MCDGRFHCPGGMEEKYCQRTSCPGRFHCYKGNEHSTNIICIHPSSICDKHGRLDCPYGDDEYFCSYNFPECPINCTCRLFSIDCDRVKGFDWNKKYPYISVNISKLSVSNMSNILSFFLTSFNHTYILTLSENAIFNLCNNMDKSNLDTTKNMLRLDLSRNKIDSIQNNCFNNMPRLFYGNLSRNVIKKISKPIFQKSHNLRILDISFNSILILQSHIFNKLNLLFLIDVRGNPIIEVSYSTFGHLNISIIYTSSYKVCCVKPKKETICKKIPPWPNSCARLLVDKSVQTIMSLIGYSGVLLNLTVFFIHKICKTNTSYNINVLFISLGDFLFSVCLVNIVSVDTIYGNTYLERENHWRGSVLCYIISVCSIGSTILSCIFLDFLALIKYLAVHKPLGIRHLTPKHVVSILLIACFLSLLISLSLMIIYRFESEANQLPSGLCLLIGNLDRSVISKIVASLTIVFQLLSSFTVTILFVLMAREMKIRKDNLGKLTGDISDTTKRGGTSKVAVASITNIICWLPSSVILILTFTWKHYPYKVLIWATTLVLPLNGIINPFVLVYAKSINRTLMKCSWYQHGHFDSKKDQVSGKSQASSRPIK